MARIVVGIDRSGHARRALAWAVEEAHLRQATLELVHAYPTAELTAMPAVVPLPADAELRAASRAIVSDALERVGGTGDIETRTTVRPGGAAGVLCEVAQGADLLVVGARGYGGFRGLLLGSVTHQVVAHSPCPIAVVTASEHSPVGWGQPTGVASGDA